MSSVEKKIDGCNCPFCHTELTPSKNNNIHSEFWSCEKCRYKGKNLWHWYFGFGNYQNEATEKHWEIHFRIIDDPEYGWKLCDSTNMPLVRERFVLS